MSINYWNQGAFFYTDFILIAVILALILLMALLVTLFNLKNPINKKILKFALLAELFLIVLVGAGHWHYREYRQADDLAYANLRDRHKVTFGYKYYTAEQAAYGKQAQNLAAIDTLGFYEAQPVTESIEFLGKYYDNYYFSWRSGIYYLKEDVVFVADKTAQLVGQQYHLTNLDFTDVGFFEETNYYLDHIEIPESLQDLEYNPDGNPRSKKFASSQGTWACLKE